LVLGAQVYDADVEGVVRAAAAGALALELAPDLLGEPDHRASSHPSAVAAGRGGGQLLPRRKRSAKNRDCPLKS
jgi:hypothetical protein